jgi:hypothetical protein
MAKGEPGSLPGRYYAPTPSGALEGGSGSLELAGDWTLTGTFNPGTGQTRFVDGCEIGSSTISGSNTFNDLSLTTTTGKQVFFGQEQTTTVNGALALAGASRNLLQIRSTVDGSEAFLNVQGSASGDFVDADNHATGGTTYRARPD